MKNIKYLFVLLVLILASPLWSQWNTHRSVLADHTWYKIGVVEDGVYGLDYAALRSWGVDVSRLDPSEIRMFGNVAGALPEANSMDRYDDLAEIAIQVTGADDGSFDEGDRILFYGQSSLNVKWMSGTHFQHERNPYSDTVYYFLCIDSGDTGLRMEDQASVPTDATTPTVTEFPDFCFHESEELSPYASGRVWFGDLFTGQEGFKEFQFDIPGLVTSHGLWVDTRVMGRSKPISFFNLSLNDELLAGHQPVEPYDDREYGKMYSFYVLAHPDAEQIALRYEFEPGEGNPMLFIDYYLLTFWRQLRFEGGDLAFRAVPAQLMEGLTKVEVSGADASLECWDVTNPLHPFRQLTEDGDNGTFFGMEGLGERRYRMFGPDGIKPVASFRKIDNQNLHGLEDAELMIITPRVFWEQAQALALFHEEQDHMDCVVVDVEEIYNEFSTGMVDPTALRDMIRMVYQRSEGRLQYVLLFGKGTHDYRNIKGIGNSFVPTYENAYNPCSEVGSMCSDDYFGLMGFDEGNNCDGKVDLGVGRIPITTTEQGDGVVRKIKHYVDLDATHGAWKNNHLLMADNDSKVYSNYAEILGTIIDTVCLPAMVKKLYLDSYPVVNTPSGPRVPLAHQALMDYFEEGFNAMSYTGHGGVKNLSGEWVLALSDILSLSNYDKLPFIHTATCEFSKFDKPDVVSGGELLSLNPNGGAIALLTTVRPTQALINQYMSKSVSQHLYEKVDGQSLRFGDFYRIVKSDPLYYRKGNMVYVLMGDPALRMSYPTHSVVTDEIYGDDFVTIKGVVLNPEGDVDLQFNGILELKLYDQKTRFTTLGQFDTPLDYSFYYNVLFEGKASVSEGKFETTIPLPSAVCQGDGKTRLSYYAYDSIRKVDANGVYDGYPLHIPHEVVDSQGPDIQIYWNTPEFVSGDTVSPHGTLYVDLFDEHGIYHYNVSIGRDIVMRSNMPAYDNKILNDRYEPVLDDYRRGRIVIPMDEMEDGVHYFSLKAWDTWNNVTEVEMEMVVEHNTWLAQIQAFPNPFDGEVFFSFVDGEMTQELEVLLEVFDMTGHRVAVVQEHTSSLVGTVPLIRWDGRAEGGHTLRPGVYAYRLIVTDSEGKTRSVAHRLIKK